MPFSAAEATNRRAKSASTGREPTRKRPRSASPSGVLTRAFSARMRSHGLSTPRLTAASKQPPPETSRYAKPARSRISASRSCSAVGMAPGERLLPEQADGRVGEGRHGRDLTAPSPAARAAGRRASVDRRAERPSARRRSDTSTQASRTGRLVRRQTSLLAADDRSARGRAAPRTSSRRRSHACGRRSAVRGRKTRRRWRPRAATDERERPATCDIYARLM